MEPPWSMNCLAEALGWHSLGRLRFRPPIESAVRPRHAAGHRSVAMVQEDLRPAKVLTRAAFLNAIRVNTALGGSTNCPPHLIAIARMRGRVVVTRLGNLRV